MERAKPIMASPSMVSLTECVSRTKSLRPHAASSFRTCSLTVDCLRFRLAPASVKLRVRATATKLFSQLGSSITLDIPIYDNSNSGHASLQWHAYRRPGQNEKNPDFVRSLYRTHDDNDRVRGSFSCPRRGCGHCGNHGGRRDRLPVFSLWYEAFAKGGGCRFVPVEAPYSGSVIHIRTVSRFRGRYFPLSLGCPAVAPHGWGGAPLLDAVDGAVVNCVHVDCRG